MIDRENEAARLIAAADEAPQLVVMRGRRRVGKSYLLNHAFEGRRFIYFQADEGEERGHLDLLAGVVADLVSAPIAFQDWDAALEYLGAVAAEERLVVALDEFQWMLRAQPQLDSKIVRHFDEWERSGRNLTLVLSGSALTLMEELIEGARPMFGRAGYRPLIEPFPPPVATLFASPSISDEAKVRRFGALGGTAQYQVWAGRSALGTVIRERILTKGEPLYEEPLQLIRGEDEIREPGSYYEILRVIATGSTQFSEIESKSKITSRSLLSKRLKRLESLRYIQQREPVGGNGTALWEAADPYFAFWFRYVYPNRSRLAMGRVEEVADAIEADMDNYMGWVLERICRDWAAARAPHPEFAEAAEVGSYWTRTHNVEVDVVARTKRRYTALGSCKWSANADTHTLDDLEESRDAISGAADAKLFIFARGFNKALTERAKNEGVTLVGIAELLA